MRIMISHNGEDLGPYGLNEARTLFRNNDVSLDDWAWVEGTPDWVRLREVPGLLPIPPGQTPLTKQPLTPPRPAPDSTTALPEEQDIWRGHPSQIRNLGAYTAWAFLLAASLGLGFYRTELLFVTAGLAVLALLHAGYLYLRLRMVQYAITTQRVRIISGLFSKSIEEIELFRVKDTAARQSILQRLFGVGTMTILSGDERTPKLVLEGIPRALELREQVRHDVMTLRQRLGIREIDLMKDQ